ncbi:hypothetical protein PFICI_00234 [Pestalotiopsis fici W106-1]|uniref:Uncharacterized protein n=1 Tax=Pestalotiopsis fici (strain W106-1 / CGMCC3.15140) TaxID=1229662 RepID=W3XMB0_PESFW|nr:uncharacterized protein PFICI_00234 [Pestalotiopsis fici W106-1]ETS86406.1 hypothetical protein PFICI_00234 [Pestalotiopsis fici W106-1]
MCLLVNTYKTCALFGHPIDDTNAHGFEMVLCDEAEANNDTFGECSSVETRNIADCSYPLCTECDAADKEMRRQVEAILELNEEAGAIETPVVTEDFVQRLRGIPIDRSRAPGVSVEDMLHFLRQGTIRDVPEVDQRRAEAWARCKRRELGSKGDLPTTTRQMFAHWLVMACKVRHIMAARRLARAEGDGHRDILLESLTTQTSLASVYRARLVNLGVFEKYLLLAGICEFPTRATWLSSELDAISEEVDLEISKTDQKVDVADPVTSGRVEL